MIALLALLIFGDGFELDDGNKVPPPEPVPHLGFYQVYTDSFGQPKERNLAETEGHSTIVTVLVQSPKLMDALNLICPERRVILLAGYPNAYPIDVALWRAAIAAHPGCVRFFESVDEYDFVGWSVGAVEALHQTLRSIDPNIPIWLNVAAGASPGCRQVREMPPIPAMTDVLSVTPCYGTFGISHLIWLKTHAERLGVQMAVVGDGWNGWDFCSLQSCREAKSLERAAQIDRVSEFIRIENADQDGTSVVLRIPFVWNWPTFASNPGQGVREYDILKTKYREIIDEEK